MASFYEEKPDTVFRFGDVVDGFEYVFSKLDEPHFGEDEHNQWNVVVERPRFCIMLTPCCSIEGGEILVAPLRRLRFEMLKNELLAKDPTMINDVVEPEKMLPSQAWEKMPADERSRRLAAGKGYMFNSLFAFAAHPLLPKYTLKGRELLCYMCDFKECVRVQTKIASRNRELPDGMKILQLSRRVRHLLRLKCSDFYNRVPDEDKDIIETA